MESKPRKINVDNHVLAYLGDYLNALKAHIKRKATALSIQKPQDK
jgi:hypothetical protein